MEKWIYYGLFLDKENRNKLLKVINEHNLDEALSKATKVYIDHCTLLHISNMTSSIDNRRAELIKNWLDRLLKFGMTQAEITVTHIGMSIKAMAFKVELPPNQLNNCEICYNKVPHITIATFGNGKPVNSNNIIDWVPLNEPVTVQVTLKRI